MSDNRLNLDVVTETAKKINNGEQKEVSCLGKTFANDDERREYFREELRKKLPELKKMEGYPIGEDDDIIELSDPPYYTACPNPWLNDFVAEWEEEKKALEANGKRKADFEVRTPYASDVSEGKNNPIYNAHSYHTKVPHPAIMRYILHYTQPGDIILDGFAGTGMTGVAAQMCGKPDAETKLKIEQDFKNQGYSKPIWGTRYAFLGDLSPVASFIAYNYNTPVKAKIFEAQAKKILAEVENECGWMYETHHTDGSLGKINYVVWSDVFICPDCGGEIIFFDAAVDKAKGKVKETFACPVCGTVHTKKDVKKSMQTVFDKALNKTIQQAKTVPAMISYFDKNGKKHEKKPDDFDLDLIKKIDNADIPYWCPTERTCEGKETRRNDSSGITNVHQFYTKRNLWILAAIKNKCFTPLQHLMFNSQLINLSKMNRFRPGVSFPYNPLSGTMYIGSQTSEANVFKAYENKISRLAEAIDLLTHQNVLTLSSAEQLSIQDNSVDYIFTDPPFGANIMYSELNFIQESWLKVKTNNKEEAIENDVQNKGILEYQNIMQKCFAEYFRVLKPGCWMTVEFSNTAANVWNSIQLALNRVGFVIANVSSLDKQQGSFKAVTTPTAVKQDLVISCYKPSETFLQKFTIQDGQANTWSFVEEQLSHLPMPSYRDGVEFVSIVERSPKVLYDRLITFFLMRGLPVPIDAADFQEGLRKRFIEEDGMMFTRDQLGEYANLKQKHKLQPSQISMGLNLIVTEADAIAWLNVQLKKHPQKYQDLQPGFRKANMANRKGENPIELMTVLEENFIKQDDDTWRIPDLNEAKDREILRNKALLKIWDGYCKDLDEGKVKKLKEVRLEALKAGFKKCFQDKDFARIKLMGEKIPENILTEDETLLNYYDIACSKV